MRLKTIALLLLALVAVEGCGKKSSLYLVPGKKKPPQAAPAAQPASNPAAAGGNAAVKVTAPKPVGGSGPAG